MNRTYKVKNLIMYHFHNDEMYSDKWKVGNILDTTEVNFINDYHDGVINCIPIIAVGDKRYPVLDTVYCLKDMIADGKTYTKEDALKYLDFISRAIRDEEVTTSELVLEDIRKEFYPGRVSRTNCIWLCTKKQLEFWDKIFNNSRSLYKVEVTGEMFKTNEQLLPNPNLSIANKRKSAHRYWNPDFSKVDETHDEFLFRGKIKVLEKLR